MPCGHRSQLVYGILQTQDTQRAWAGLILGHSGMQASPQCDIEAERGSVVEGASGFYEGRDSACSSFGLEFGHTFKSESEVACSRDQKLTLRLCTPTPVLPIESCGDRR